MEYIKEDNFVYPIHNTKSFKLIIITFFIGITRRDFMKGSLAAIAGLTLSQTSVRGQHKTQTQTDIPNKEMYEQLKAVLSLGNYCVEYLPKDRTGWKKGDWIVADNHNLERTYKLPVGCVQEVIRSFGQPVVRKHELTYAYFQRNHPEW